jgi:hypothetical protein
MRWIIGPPEIQDIRLEINDNLVPYFLHNPWGYHPFDPPCGQRLSGGWPMLSLSGILTKASRRLGLIYLSLHSGQCFLKYACPFHPNRWAMSAALSFGKVPSLHTARIISVSMSHFSAFRQPLQLSSSHIS